MSTIVSHKHKFIFVHIPRTGGTSFTEAVKPFLGENDELNAWPKHTPFRTMDNPNSRLYSAFRSYTKVAILRDDKERFESLCKIKDIREYSPQDEFWWNNEMWLYGSDGNALFDILIDFDSLPDSAIEFLATVGINIGEFPHLNKK